MIFLDGVGLVFLLVLWLMKSLVVMVKFMGIWSCILLIGCRNLLSLFMIFSCVLGSWGSNIFLSGLLIGLFISWRSKMMREMRWFFWSFWIDGRILKSL